MLLRFYNREDYLLVLLKESLFIHGKPFWFSKWTMNFCPDEDSPIVPVWLEFPGLPPNFYNRGMLQSIACSIGPVLHIERSTLCLTRTDAARVCVHMDVSKQRPERVWVGAGSSGNWQRIVYPAWPLFCSGCKHLGHDFSKCKRKLSHPLDPSARGGDSPIWCDHCKNNSHLTIQCKLKQSSSAILVGPHGRAPSAANVTKGKIALASNGLPTTQLGSKAPAQNWRVVGSHAPPQATGLSAAPASLHNDALLAPSNSISGADGLALALASSSGHGEAPAST